MDYFSEEWAACLFKWAMREPRFVLLLHSANVRVNEVRLLFFLEMSRLGVREKVLKISKTPSLTAAKATESICLPIPPKPFDNIGGMAR